MLTHSVFFDIQAFSIINPAANLPPPCLTQWAEPGRWRPCFEQRCSFRQSWVPKPAHKLAPRMFAESGMRSARRCTSNFLYNAGFPGLSVLVGWKHSIYSLFHTPHPHIWFPFLGFCPFGQGSPLSSKGHRRLHSRDEGTVCWWKNLPNKSKILSRK